MNSVIIEREDKQGMLLTLCNLSLKCNQHHYCKGMIFEISHFWGVIMAIWRGLCLPWKYAN
jgi:hypothetical protein